MPYSLNKAKTIWTEDYGATLHQNVAGENNPMFGKQHSNKTKQLISKKGKERYKNEDYRKRSTEVMIEGNRKVGYAAQKLPRKPREIRECVNEDCSNKFEVIETSKKRYCSIECVCKTISKLGSSKEHEMALDAHKKIKEYILEWASNHKEIIKNTPYNKINSSLSQLFEEIQKRFDIKDLRIISKAIFGENKGRKALLKYLKDL